MGYCIDIPTCERVVYSHLKRGSESLHLSHKFTKVLISMSVRNRSALEKGREMQQPWLLELVARVRQRGGSCLEIPLLSAPDMQSHRYLLGHTEVYHLWISVLFIHFTSNSFHWILQV